MSYVKSLAEETSGTAQWIAELVVLVVGDLPVWVIQLAVAALATVLLVPPSANIALASVPTRPCLR
jgi:di/tricarboxylate transporter